MRAIIGGVIIAGLAGFLYFHAPNGEMVIIDRGKDTALIIRPSPPGYICCTLIESGSGVAIVKESVCEVAHEFEQMCAKDMKAAEDAKKKEAPK